MNIKKIKWIIESDRFLIIGLTVFSLIVYLLGIYLSSIKFKSEYELKFRNGKTHRIELETTAEQSKSNSVIPLDEEWEKIVKEEYNITPDNILEKKLISENISSRRFPLFKKVALSMKTVGVLFFFIAYPLYFLIRFILWELMTSREK